MWATVTLCYHVGTQVAFLPGVLMWSSLCVCVLISSCKDTSHLDQGPPSMSQL